jgi:hypothetical protein
MFNFNNFLKELRAGAVEIAKKESSEYLKEAKGDCQDFLNSVKADLKRWTKLLAEGKLTKEDYQFLVKGKKDLAEMNALTEAGLASIRIDRIRIALIDLIINAAFKVV